MDPELQHLVWISNYFKFDDPLLFLQGKHLFSIPFSFYADAADISQNRNGRLDESELLQKPSRSKGKRLRICKTRCMGRNSDASELHVSKHEALDADKTPHEHSTCKLNPAVSCDRTGPNRTVPNITVKCHG